MVMKKYVVVYEVDGIENEFRCEDTSEEGASNQAWYDIAEEVGTERYAQKYIYEE